MNFRNVKYIRNYDGDTITVDIPWVHEFLGKAIPIRVRGIDAEEIKTKSEKSKQAKQFVQEWLEVAKQIDLINVERGKYFRIVADVIVDGMSLAEELVRLGLAIRKDYK